LLASKINKDNDNFEKVEEPQKTPKVPANFKEILPPGTPGRPSFKIIPKKKKHFWRPEALRLRSLFTPFFPFHFVFLIGDIFFYELEVLPIFYDVFLSWLCFFNYMTLNKVTCLV